MADDVALRARRSRLHRRGDHSLCKSGRCDPVLQFSPRIESGVVEAYRSALEAAGRLDSPEGQLVMVLVEQLVQPARHTASALATLSRELRAAYEVAVDGTGQKADVIDVIFGTA